MVVTWRFCVLTFHLLLGVRDKQGKLTIVFSCRMVNGFQVCHRNHVFECVIVRELADCLLLRIVDGDTAIFVLDGIRKRL